MPRISIILPTYNNGRYLQSAIKSVLVQSFQDFKLLVINDGSTDNTGEILSSFNDDRLQIIDHPTNQGLIASLNEGLKLCDSEFCARMDGDDLIHQNKLKTQLQFMVSHPEVAMCGTRMRSSGTKRFYNYPTGSEEIRTELLVNNVLSHPSLMWRQQFFVDHDFAFNPDFIGAEDYELWTRVADQGQIVNLPQTLHYYRLHKNRETVRKTLLQTHNFARVIAREIDHKWPGQFNLAELIFLFDFNRLKTLADLQTTQQIIEQIFMLNEKQPFYQPEILRKTLWEKWLTCCSATAYLGKPVWQLWKNSRWFKKYSFQQRFFYQRVAWFYHKTHHRSPAN